MKNTEEKQPNPNKPSELNKKLTTFIKQLATETDEARISEVMQEYFKFCASFYKYSVSNQFLIFLSKPDATNVAGFHDWLKRKRYVKKGENGIPILAPCGTVTIKDKEDKVIAQEMRFKTVYVFDVSQTDGEELPEPPEWKSNEKYPELEDMLIRYAKLLNIKVDIQDLSAMGAQGYSSGGNIVLDPTAGTKTLIHEIAHELLHHNEKSKKRPRQEVELEAEAVAYVVARALEIKDLKSPNYLAIWDADGRKILDRLDLIRETANKILTAIFPVK